MTAGQMFSKQQPSPQLAFILRLTKQKVAFMTSLLLHGEMLSRLQSLLLLLVVESSKENLGGVKSTFLDRGPKKWIVTHKSSCGNECVNLKCLSFGLYVFPLSYISPGSFWWMIALCVLSGSHNGSTCNLLVDTRG